MKGPSTRQKLAPLLAKLRGLRDPALDMVATEGSPVEAVLKRLFPDYESQNRAGLYAKEPDTLGLAMMGSNKLERMVAAGKVPTDPRVGSMLDVLRSTPALKKEMMSRAKNAGDPNKFMAAEGKHLSRREFRTPEPDLDQVVKTGRFDDVALANEANRDANKIRLINEPGKTLAETIRPLNMVEIEEARRLGVDEKLIKYLSEGPSVIQLNLAGMPKLRQRMDAAIGSMPGLKGDFTTPRVTDPTLMRMVLAHEKGERAVHNYDAPNVSFSSHAGPEARLREFEFAAGRSYPAYAVAEMTAALQKDPLEQLLARKLREFGGTPNKAVPTNSRRADKIVELLRRKKEEMPDRGLGRPDPPEYPGPRPNPRYRR